MFSSYFKDKNGLMKSFKEPKKLSTRQYDYWRRRILNRKIKYIKFQYGYTKSYMIVECTDVILNNDKFELHLGEIKHVENY